MIRQVKRTASWALVVIALTATACLAADEIGMVRSVPAEFVSSLSLPGEGNAVRRPASLRFDRIHREILVCDAGNNRVVITDDRGIYRFEIPGGERFSMPMDTAVDSRGFIHVLGSTPFGVRLFRYDFDGLDLGEVPFLAPAGEDFEPASVAFAADDRLVVVDRAGPGLHVFDRDGGHIRGWELEAGGGLQTSGRLTVRDDRILVPMPATGSVIEYDLRGNVVARHGVPGTNVGELNFPVAVDATDEGLLLVLDKHRFAVVCYGPGGAFVGEFGGKGDRNGWFYHPSHLVELGGGELYVAQIFRDRIQRLIIPQFIRDAARGVPQSSGTQS